MFGCSTGHADLPECSFPGCWVVAFQIPNLPDTLSTPYRRVLRSFVLNNAADRPTPEQAFRRLACLCFGPIHVLDGLDDDDSDSVADRRVKSGREMVGDADECDAWLHRRRVELLCRGRWSDEDAVEYELRAVYLGSGDGARVWDDVRAVWGR